MKKFFTVIFFLAGFSLSALAQTYTAFASHGCGGATITTVNGNFSYDYQRFFAGNWATVHNSTANYYVILPNEVTVATNYRVVITNNITSVVDITNSVIIDPSSMNQSVPVPTINITANWSSTCDNANNFFGVYISGYNSVMRPPWNIEYKKGTDLQWTSVVSGSGINIPNITPGLSYNFRVTDYCGNLTAITSSSLTYTVDAVVSQQPIACNDGALSFSVYTGGIFGTGGGVPPIQYAYAYWPGNMSLTDVLNSLQFTNSNIASNLAPGRYIVRAKDSCGNLSTPNSQINVGGGNPILGYFVPQVIPGNPCARRVTMTTSQGAAPFQYGYRNATSPGFVFQSSPVLDLTSNGLYYFVVKDRCGVFSDSLSLQIDIPLLTINNITQQDSTAYCGRKVTVNASNINGPVTYALDSNSVGIPVFQASNIFNDVAAGGHKFWVKDDCRTESKLLSVYKTPTTFNTTWAAEPSNCSLYSLKAIDIVGVHGPNKFAISKEGSNNFSPFSDSAVFHNLQPGRYFMQVQDNCGNVNYNYGGEAGTFYRGYSTIQESCNGGDKLGGSIHIDITNGNGQNYMVQLRELIAVSPQLKYGNIVRKLTTTDTSFIFDHLPTGQYKVIITGNCGDTLKDEYGREYISIYVNSILPNIYVANQFLNGDCTKPTIVLLYNLPANRIVSIYEGRNTSGPLVPMLNDSTTNILAGGYYTIKVTSADVNGCYWEYYYYDYFLATTASASSGVVNNLSPVICRLGQQPVRLADFLDNESPGGIWSTVSTSLVGFDGNDGSLVPSGNLPGTYTFTYKITTQCGNVLQSAITLRLNDSGCVIRTVYGDFQSAASTLGCTSLTGTNWINMTDINGNLVYSVLPGNSNSLINVCWGLRVVNNGGAVLRQTTINNQAHYFMDRNIFIQPGSLNITNPPVKVRIYFTNEELQHMLNYLHANGSPQATAADLRILKKNGTAGSPVDLEVTNENNASTQQLAYISPTLVAFGANWFFEFDVTGFSEFNPFFSNATTIPLQWMNVTGTIRNNYSEINWSTAQEQQTSKFIIEHSSDATIYKPIGSVVAKGNSNIVSNYSFIHTTAFEGMNYYRIKQVDQDGHFSYSKVVSLFYKSMGDKFLLAPNPAHDYLQLIIDPASKTERVDFYTMSGQLVLSQTMRPGVQPQQINISQLPNAVYSVRIVQRMAVKVIQLIKQ